MRIYMLQWHQCARKHLKHDLEACAMLSWKMAKSNLRRMQYADVYTIIQSLIIQSLLAF